MLLVGVVRRQVHFIGGGDEAARRVDGARQIGEGGEAVPFIAAIAGHRQQAIPVGAARRFAGGEPGDIALAIGVNLIDRWRGPAVQAAFELRQRPGFHIGERGEIGRRPGGKPDRAHGIGAVAGQIFVHHRAVAGEFQRHGLRRRAAHLDGFLHHLHRFPAFAIAVAIRVGGVGFVDIQILLIHRENGQAEGAEAVVADGNAGQSRLTGADHVDAGAGQMGDHPQ